MFDPLRPLRVLPWGSLLQVGLAAILMLTLVERILLLAVPYVGLLAGVVEAFEGPWGGWLNMIVAFGVGGLAVWILERWFTTVSRATKTLWALVPCIILWWIVKSHLPVPQVFAASGNELFGVAIGVFVQGQRYWR
jgi:hypothetical protein